MTAEQPHAGGVAQPLARPVGDVVAERLAALPADVDGHVAAYEDIDRLLQDALATLDEV